MISKKEKKSFHNIITECRYIWRHLDQARVPQRK